MKTYIIYEISCLDTNITDIYIGSTTNFRVRKSNHKMCCNNINSKQYNQHIYNIIRENGGWNNWNMHPIEQIDYETIIECRIREQYWIDLKKSKLNMVKAYISEEQMKAQQADYRDANKDKIKAQNAVYNDANKDKMKAYKAEYNDVNRNKIKARYAVYNDANKDKIKAHKAEYRDANRDKIKAYNAEYNDANKDKIKAQKALYRNANKDIINQQRREKYAKKKAELLIVN